MARSINVTFCGGAGSVTGSNFLIEGQEVKALVDCGMFQGGKDDDERNQGRFPYDPKEINALFVTHGHADHVGRIPFLMKAGFRGKIYSTPPTHDIAELILSDSAGILAKEARREHEKPLYTKEDIDQAMSMWETRGYHESIDLGEGISVQLRDAGHILGSSMVEFSRDGKRLVFTGDLGNSPAPLLSDTEPITGVSYLVTESVYGDRNHEDVRERGALFEDIIEDTISRGGVLMIPAFSVERTQDLLYELNDLVENKRIPDVPVYLDSPLAIKVTEVYKKYEDYFNKTAQRTIDSGDKIFQFPRLRQTLDSRDSFEISKTPNPKVIIAGSGMSTGGRILRHEKENLGDPKSTLLIVGYQAPGTLGRKLMEGETRVMIDGEHITVRARIERISGYSAHKDSNALVEFVATGADSLKKIFVVLGEPLSSTYLAQRVRDYLGLDARVPQQGDKVTLEF